MQLDSIGAEHSHLSHHLKITSCVDDNGSTRKKGGAGLNDGGNYSDSAVPTQETEKEGMFSLYAWLERTHRKGKQLLERIWGDNGGVKVGDSGGEKVGDNRGASSEISKDNALTAAASIVHSPARQVTPYFAAVEDKGEKQQVLREKIKVRFQAVTGFLTRQFSGQSTFQPGQKAPREDMRRHSRYRDKDLEIECVLTDDSYLLDSYDRKGEYRKITVTHDH